MPGIEIKGRSKRANYRHGGRTGFKHGSSTPLKPKSVDGIGKKAKKIFNFETTQRKRKIELEPRN